MVTAWAVGTSELEGDDGTAGSVEADRDSSSPAYACTSVSIISLKHAAQPNIEVMSAMWTRWVGHG